MESKYRVSIVTTGRNEVGNVEPFLEGALQAIATMGVTGEIIYIDDGSTDGTGQAVQRYANEHTDVPIKLVTHQVSMGITYAIAETASLASGELVCLVPADLESVPEDDIPILYNAMDADTDVVVGWRKGRGDGKLFASSIYNYINRILFNVYLHDANWIKLIRREKLLNIKLRADWHRYLMPILVHRGCRVKEVETQWKKRTYGSSNFGLRRIPLSLVDMVSVKLFLSYGERPLLLFSWLGVFSFMLSFVSLVVSIFSGAGGRLWSYALATFSVFLMAGIISVLIGIAVDLIRNNNAE